MFKLPDLPFQKTDLAPYMSEDTLSFHHGKHHKTYVDNLNNFTKDTDWAEMELEDVILKSHGKPEHVAIFNNSAQIWNHTFFWNCLKKGGGGSPKGHLLERIEKDFGSLDAFKEQFKKAALTQFGSGWAWLVEDNGVLKVEKTPNAETPEDCHKILINLNFPANSADKPILSIAMKKFDIPLNIIGGNLKSLKNTTIGILWITIPIEYKNVEEFVSFLNENGVSHKISGYI